MTDPCIVCGLPISRSGQKDVLRTLLLRAARGEGAWLLTLNTEMLSRISKDPGYRSLVARADIITADGMPLVWASRFNGSRESIQERTTGVDLVHAFLQETEAIPYAIIGGINPAVTVTRYGTSAVNACRYLYTGKVDLSDAQTLEFVAVLRAKGVRMLFLALGVPKQDELALKLRTNMPELVVLGVGGSFEILGPSGRRAPLWMQRSGLEWLFRLTLEPGRLWKRYLIGYPKGISLLMKDTLRSRLAANRR